MPTRFRNLEVTTGPVDAFTLSIKFKMTGHQPSVTRVDTYIHRGSILPLVGEFLIWFARSETGLVQIHCPV